MTSHIIYGYSLLNSEPPFLRARIISLELTLFSHFAASSYEDSLSINLLIYDIIPDFENTISLSY